MYTYSRMEGKKKRNCPIDDEGLRFIIAREHRTQKKIACTPSRRAGQNQNVNFSSSTSVGGSPRVSIRFEDFWSCARCLGNRRRREWEAANINVRVGWFRSPTWWVYVSVYVQGS